MDGSWSGVARRGRTRRRTTFTLDVTSTSRACHGVGHFELKDCELYASCEPCPMCLGAVYWARLGRLYFAANRMDAAAIGFDDSLIYDELAVPLQQRRIPTLGLMREQGLVAFREWTESTTKVPY